MAFVQNGYGIWIEDAVIPGKEGGEHLNDNFNMLAERAPKLMFETNDPGINDDISQGFTQLSRWLNMLTGDVWTLQDPAAGAAVWVRSPNLSSTGELITKILFRQATAATMDTVVLDQGEPGWSTDDKSFRVGDASTPGGIKIRATKILTLTFLTTDSSTVFIDHQDADVVIFACTATNLSVTKTFDVKGNAPSPAPAFNAYGLKAGSVPGQRLTLIFNLSSIHNDGGATQGGIIVNLSGNLFSWNSDAFDVQGVTKRAFGTEIDQFGDDATYNGHYAINLFWDGNYWCPTNDASLGSSASMGSIIGGRYVTAGTYSIAVGDTLNTGSNVSYCAVFGASNVIRGNYGFISGYNNSGGINALYTAMIGANHGMFVSTSNLYTFQSGNGTRVRIPGQRAFAASFPSGQGTSQGTDVILQATTSNATPTNMSAGGIHYVVQPQHCVCINYQCVGNLSQSSGGSAGAVIYRGSITVIRDNAGTTTIAGADHRDVSDTFGDATAAGMSMTISVDDATDKLHFQVTGHATRAVNWVCRLTTVDAGMTASST